MPRTAAIDAMIAVVVAAAVLIVSPGTAVTAVIALLVVLACALSFAAEALTRRGRPRSRR